MTEKPFRLLFFIPDGYPTYRPDVTVLFGNALPKFGVHSDLVAQAVEEVAGGKLPGWPAGRCHVCPRSAGRMKNLLRSFLFNLRILRQFSAGTCDAIQVRDMAFFAVPTMWRARRLRLPFFYWMSYPIYEGSIELARAHGLQLGLVRFLFFTLKGHLGKWLLYSYVLPRADHVFVQSERMQADVVAQGIGREKMTPVPMGADMVRIDRQTILRSDDTRLIGKRVIVYLGILERNRRIDFLFEVLKRVLQEEPKALLVLAGEASEEIDRTWLQQCAIDCGVDHAVLKTGWLPIEKAWAFVKSAEVGVSPIRPDPLLDCGSPTKAIEYLALGIPAVANDQPDQSKVLGESQAGICVPYTADAFASAILTILQNPDIAAEMARRGPAYVRTHRSYETLGRMVAGKYSQLITGARAEAADESTRSDSQR